MSFPVGIPGSPGMEKVVDTTRNGLRPGTLMYFEDGRLFRWAQNGAVALLPGRLLQQSVRVAGHFSGLVVQEARAIGAATIALTNATTAITANQYQFGYANIHDGAGEGHKYAIKSHPAEATGTGTVIITLEDDDTIRVALTVATSLVGLRRHPYDEVIVNPTTPTGVPVGVTCVDVPIDNFFWCQTHGSCTVLINGTVIVGNLVTAGATTAGSVDVHPLNSVDASGQQVVVGRVETVMATTEHGDIFLTID